MSLQIFSRSVAIDAPVEMLFQYHERPGAFNRINPPWEPVELMEHTGGIRDGAKVDLKFQIGPVPLRWRLTHQNYIENQQFEDAQISGPFAHWVHRHLMKPNGANHSTLEDSIEYKLPLGILGQLFGGAFARAKLERMFKYRHEMTVQDINTFQRYPPQPLTIAITGASGMIGTALSAFLSLGGHTVKPLVRSKSAAKNGAIYWNPDDGTLNPADLEGVDAVIHLAGENIGAKRWSDAQKKKILESRLKGTKLLAETLAKLQHKPKVFISVSAIGIYGNRGSETLTENHPHGKDFLAQVCEAWETAANPAQQAGIRVVHPRLGIVLSMRGGALQRMLLPFLMGAGGTLGAGKQYMSWVGIDDVIGAIYHCLLTDSIEGAVNITAPKPVTNREFTRTLGKVLWRPTLIPTPKPALKLLFGELAEPLLFYSQNVQPTRLEKTGYTFRYADLESALRHVLGRK